MENGFSAPIIQIIINKQIKQTTLHMALIQLLKYSVHTKITTKLFSNMSLIGDKIKYHWAAL